MDENKEIVTDVVAEVAEVEVSDEIASVVEDNASAEDFLKKNHIIFSVKM